MTGHKSRLVDLSEQQLLMAPEEGAQWTSLASRLQLHLPAVLTKRAPHS